MNWADWAILGILGVSVLVSLLRGFVREAMSLAVWVLAFWAAFQFAEPTALWFDRFVELPSARLMLAFALIFLVALTLGGLVTYLVGQLVDKTGLSGSDRMVGMLFGAVRGLALVTAMVMLAGLTPFPRDGWWQESRLLPFFERASLWASGYLPETLGGQIGYDVGTTEGEDSESPEQDS